jgi:uncharacterized protein YndB with AHSA1/START domain
MATLTFSSVIERPAEEIFDLVADIRRNPEWCPASRGARRDADGRSGRARHRVPDLLAWHG